MKPETTNAVQLTRPTALTQAEYTALQTLIRTIFVTPEVRECPAEIANGPLEVWTEWLTTTVEPEADLLARYSAFPTPQHLVAAMSCGVLSLSSETTRLMGLWADFYEAHPEFQADLESPGMARLQTTLGARRGAERALPLGMPPIEVCRTLWALDPESPTGLASVRTGKPLKGEKLAKGVAICWRAPCGSRFSFTPADIVEFLTDDHLADGLTFADRTALVQAQQLKEERQAVTIITDAELQAINEEFPPAARLPFIDMRLRYNNRNNEFRKWDNVNKRVTFDAPAVLADMRSRIGIRTVERFERLVEQGIDLAGILCAHLRIPLTKGSLMFQDHDNRADGRI